MRNSALPLAMLILLTGCATTSDAGPFALAGSEWNFTAIDGVPSTSGATLWFQSDRFLAETGCNRMGSGWRSEGGKLIVEPLAATKMFCEGKMEQERALSELFAANPDFILSGDRLTLKSAAHSAKLARAGDITFGR